MPSARTLIDHNEIRQWAEARHAQPACVRGTGGKNDPGMIRLDFPGFSGKQSLSPISWDQWFKSFDENGLALLVQDRTARGQGSNFNKLVSRESMNGRRQKSRPTPKTSRRAKSGTAKRASAGGGGSRRRTTSTRTSSRTATRAAAKSGATRTTGQRRSSRQKQTARTKAGGARRSPR